jgi:hypothetical protein
MSTIEFKHPMLVQGRHNAVGGGVFEAELNDLPCNAQTNAELTLYLRVFFKDGFYDPEITRKIDSTKGVAKDADKIDFYVFPWDSGKFAVWKAKLLHQAKTFWTGRFWLHTPPHYSGLNWPVNHPTHRANVWCKLELTESPVEKGSHYTVACVSLGDSVDPKYQYQFRSHMFLYRSNASLHTKSHEVGHLLGLDHPSGKSGEKAAYKDRPGQPGDIMGAGLNRYPHHALPWQKAIGLITQTHGSEWKVAMHHVYPHPLHVPPHSHKSAPH